MQFTLPSRLLGIRLHHESLEGGTVPGVVASISSSSNAVDPEQPSNPGWQQITYGGASSVTLAAAISATESSITSSDVMAVSSQQRDDGGSGYVYYLSVFMPTGTNFSYYTNFGGVGAPQFDADYPTMLPPGFAFRLRRKTGDFATIANAAGFATATEQITTFPSVMLELFLEGGAQSILAVGDSLIGGTGTVAGAHPPCVSVAYALQGAGLPVHLSLHGKSGAKTWEYGPRAIKLLNLLRPDVLVYPPWSPNDTAGSITQGVLDAQKLQMLQVYEAARRQGTRLVLTTPLPWVNLNAASDSLRRSMRDWILAQQQPGVAVIDEELLSDGASPARIKAALTGDGLHPNTIGHAARVPVYTRALRDSLGLA